MKEANRGEKARALAIALAEGLASAEAVVEWVDTLIGETDRPDHHLVDASMSPRNTDELISALNRYASSRGVEAQTPAVWNHLMAHYSEWLGDHPGDAERIADALYRVRDQAPQEAERQMYYFADAYELARGGIFGDLNEINQELEDFLARWKVT